MPAEQSRQTLELVARTVVLNLPTAQLSQAASAWALKVPAGHDEQELDPGVANRPLEQSRQMLGLVAATAVLNLPAAQLSQAASPWALYVPAAQSMHELDPESLANVPAGHATQVLEVVAATVALNLPAAQPMHAAEAFVPAFGLYFPAGQFWQ